MAIVTRYFSPTASAGTADGTSWADRALLNSGANWSTVITGFNFSGSDSLRALIGPGTNTSITQSFAAAAFTNPPSMTRPVILHGCDSSGAALEPSNPSWTAATPVDWVSSLPVIETVLITPGAAFGLIARLIRFRATARSGAFIIGAAGAQLLDWCVIDQDTSNTAAIATSAMMLTNCVVRMGGTSFDVGCTVSNNGLFNVRIETTGSPTSGNRRAITHQSFANPYLERVLITGSFQGGIVGLSTQVGAYIRMVRCVIANISGSAIIGSGTAAQTLLHNVDRCLITGNGGAGADADASRFAVTNSRLRDNTSGNFLNIGDWPTDLSNYTTDSDDATEYVNAAGGDFRIKYGSAIWGQGYGVADAPPTDADIAAAVWAYANRSLT